METVVVGVTGGVTAVVTVPEIIPPSQRERSQFLGIFPGIVPRKDGGGKFHRHCVFRDMLPICRVWVTKLREVFVDRMEVSAVKGRPQVNHGDLGVAVNSAHTRVQLLVRQPSKCNSEEFVIPLKC